MNYSKHNGHALPEKKKCYVLTLCLLLRTVITQRGMTHDQTAEQIFFVILSLRWQREKISLLFVQDSANVRYFGTCSVFPPSITMTRRNLRFRTLVLILTATARH